jgi:subfamily B ATP-binding cassette protein MsbA
VLYRLQARVKALEAQKAMLASYSASVEEVRKLLDRADKPYLSSGSRRLDDVGGIEFRKVTLKHQTADTSALQEVSFTLAAGKNTALVGPSGAGKSSVVNLLCRFYDPTSGQIEAGGEDLKGLDLPWWRSQIALVSQDVHLFNASVADNIAYGKPGASREEIEKAATLASADEFIRNLPAGLETVLGERGMRLSGGERQRLALARALIRDPKILILDEATNALDTVTENAIQEVLATYSRGRIVLTIAHRLRTIEHADYIIVLENGRIAEQGERSKLLASEGLFHKLLALDRSHGIPT